MFAGALAVILLLRLIWKLKQHGGAGHASEYIKLSTRSPSPSESTPISLPLCRLPLESEIIPESLTDYIFFSWEAGYVYEQCDCPAFFHSMNLVCGSFPHSPRLSKVQQELQFAEHIGSVRVMQWLSPAPLAYNFWKDDLPSLYGTILFPGLLSGFLRWTSGDWDAAESIFPISISEGVIYRKRFIAGQDNALYERPRRSSAFF